MFKGLSLIMVLIIISMFLMGIMLTLFFSTFSDSEKLSPFECGFLGFEEGRSPFSVHFFLVSLVFLIFDMELLLIFPYLSSMKEESVLFPSFSLSVFLVFLTLGLLVEWEKQVLDWQK